MTQNENNKVKIRLKLRSGEEFEAEGSPEFIEKQRADFLQLIGKSNKAAEQSSFSKSLPPAVSARPVLPKSYQPQNTLSQNYLAKNTLSQEYPEPSPFPKNYPAQTAPASSFSTPTHHITPSGLSAAEYSQNRASQTTGRSANNQALPLFEQIIKEQDGLLILRRKSRLLSAETAALLLIAAPRNHQGRRQQALQSLSFV